MWQQQWSDSTFHLVTATIVAACSLDFVLSRISTISHVGAATAMAKVTTAVVAKVPAAAAAALLA